MRGKELFCSAKSFGASATPQRCLGTLEPLAAAVVSRHKPPLTS